MLVDLRSDTLTKPTPAMLDAMMSAEVGDDVFGEDPTVRALEEKCARMLGMEAGLFCPSGTMTNQIAIRILTQPQDEVICDKRSHIYLHEGGGIAYNSMVSVELLDGDRGRIAPEQIASAIKPLDIHSPRTSLVSLENTMNKGGGSFYRLDQIASIHQVCKQYGLKMHMDGARLFNALAETGENSVDYGKYFDTISICLSKGLGAPVGSLLLSNRDNIERAKRVRKVFGGGMRQSGYLAAAGIYALDHHVGRLKEDHRKARQIAEILKKCDFVESVEPADTNIIIFSLKQGFTVPDILAKMKGQQILALGFGAGSIRMVTHLHIDEDMIGYMREKLSSMK
jgi:threonine aldolase